MRHFQTVVLERLKSFRRGFETEPFEVGWANEALAFVRLHELSGGDVSMESFVQVSADGITWVDEGTRFPPIREVGDYFVKVSQFGGWLRLRNTIVGTEPELKMTIHLVLKG